MAVYLSKERTNRPASIRTSDWRTRARCRSHGGSAASQLQTRRLPRENSSAHAHQFKQNRARQIENRSIGGWFYRCPIPRFERVFFASMIINCILRFGDDSYRENLKIVERSENENPSTRSQPLLCMRKINCTINDKRNHLWSNVFEI